MSDSPLFADDALAQDDRTRNRILEELDRCFIVEAAAGTGKTTSLVHRMVALIETGTCRIDQLSAITFTRKAAAELGERFQAELRTRYQRLYASDADADGLRQRERLRVAADHAHQAFVGTVHSFCAMMLRERPVEFGVDPEFRELDEGEDRLLRQHAWDEHIAALKASGDPLIQELNDLEIERRDLKGCFDAFIEYRDVSRWPTEMPDSFDIEAARHETESYLEEMRALLPTFPVERGREKLMARYEEIVRIADRPWKSNGKFFRLLEQFRTKDGGAVLKIWATAEGGSTQLGKHHKQRWSEFRAQVAVPGLEYWCRHRYAFVVEFVRRAVKVYEQHKAVNGALDFQDLLSIAARGLAAQPELRRYFQSRFTHLLVDEFQDTDPLQAQMMLLLTSEDTNQSDWSQCVPRPGALFLVGDPKQSIYRFRRGDIITYNRVKQIVVNNQGEVLPLVKNFRSRPELLDWNNRVYRRKFGDHGTAYSPAAEDMIHGRLDTEPDEAPQLCGLYRFELPRDRNLADVREFEAEGIAKFIRHALDQGLTIPRSERELEQGCGREVGPGDFLLIPWRKKHLSVYAAALEKWGIPYQVAGGNPLSRNPQLMQLIACLRSIDDPTQPVHYLALLREFFGLSDAELYVFKRAGGRFHFRLPVPESLPVALRERLESIAAGLQRYQSWIRSLPFAAAVSRIANDLGLFAKAASTQEGDLSAGGMKKVVEWLRLQSWDFDSATDLIEFLEEILSAEDSDACPALPQDRNVVRLMNLHKAKGLEAPIVFLADTSAKYRGEVRCHIDRTGSQATGFMGITKKFGEYQKLELATPADWAAKQAEEQQFLDAEHDRLQYVATTRAGCATIVSIGKHQSNWGTLHAQLSEAPQLEVPEAADPQSTLHQEDAPDIPENWESNLQEKWSVAFSPSYSTTTAKKLGLRGTTRPNWQASGDYGHDWGSAVHELLEAAQQHPQHDLRRMGLRLVHDYRLGVERLKELLHTVEAVVQSDIWRRARGAVRCYSELPFESLQVTETGQSQIVRGVIDLLFEEPQRAGWVLVDYKTDDITKEQIDSACGYYANQLAAYAHYWTEITGARVHESGLYFTRLNTYRAV